MRRRRKGYKESSCLHYGSVQVGAKIERATSFLLSRALSVTMSIRLVTFTCIEFEFEFEFEF